MPHCWLYIYPMYSLIHLGRRYHWYFDACSAFVYLRGFWLPGPKRYTALSKEQFLWVLSQLGALCPRKRDEALLQPASFLMSGKKSGHETNELIGDIRNDQDTMQSLDLTEYHMSPQACDKITIALRKVRSLNKRRTLINLTPRTHRSRKYT